MALPSVVFDPKKNIYHHYLGSQMFSELDARTLHGSDLPPQFFKIQAVKVFLSSQELRTIPNNFSENVLLQTLDLGHNYLEELPETIGDVKTLRNLNMNGNRLVELPKTISKLNLNQLSLSGNMITELPNDLEKVQELIVSFNGLHNIPNKLAYSPTLKAINLSNNQIEYFTPQLQHLLSREDVKTRILWNPFRSLYGFKPQWKERVNISCDHLNLTKQGSETCFKCMEDDNCTSMEQYYEQSVEQIAQIMLFTKKLSSDQLERFCHEATPQIIENISNSTEITKRMKDRLLDCVARERFSE